ncbi:MAG: DHH family phosphoesterase [Patescibacteria group bacterium]
MVLSEAEQFFRAIKDSHHILIALPKEYTADAVGSALALFLILKKQDKLADIVCDGFTLQNNLKFLAAAENILPQLSNLQKFVITLDVQNNKIEEFSYNLEADKLKIYITPQTGNFKAEQVTTENSAYKYDLIITLDAPDFDALGKVYQNFTEFFFNTTVVNIDHKPENEHFGQINLVNPNAVATAEILFNLFQALEKKYLDADIATALLSGLITKTRSFKSGNVTPKTLEIAGALMAAEANRELIVKNLYRSRTLPTLNLWGRALARLKGDAGNKLIWSLISEHDFLEAGADAKDLPEVIEELISFIPGVETVVLFYQLGEKICVLVNTLKNQNALYLASAYNPEGNKNLVRFCLLGKTLPEAEKEVIGKIKEKLGTG